MSAEGYLSQEYTFEVVEGSENQVNLALEADESAFKNGQMVIVTDPPKCGSYNQRWSTTSVAGYARKSRSEN